MVDHNWNRTDCFIIYHLWLSVFSLTLSLYLFGLLPRHIRLLYRVLFSCAVVRILSQWLSDHVYRKIPRKWWFKMLWCRCLNSYIISHIIVVEFFFIFVGGFIAYYGGIAMTILLVHTNINIFILPNGWTM